MDISNQISSGFIKPADLAGGTLRDVIMDVRPGRYDRPDAEFQSGAKLSLNATNMRALAGAWGTETDNWIGKEVELYPGKTTYNGEQHDSVLVRPISPTDVAAIKASYERQRQAQKPSPRDDLNDEIPF